MMVLAIDRVLFHIVEGVVHPAHVPLEVEPQATFAHRRADARPGGGFLGDHQGTRCFFMDHLVEMTQEGDGLQVLAAAMDVGDPLALLARIVAVEHGGHGVDPQAIDMEMLQPVHGRGQHEAMHLMAPQVVNVGIPILVEALVGVFVLVQRGAVEAGQAVFVGGEMRRYPVEDNTDVRLVAGIDEGGVISRRAEARGGRELAQWLVTPGAAEGVLHDRQQLDMGETHLANVGNQALGQLPPVVQATFVTALPAPGPSVQFVHRYRRLQALEFAAPSHPVLVVPGKGLVVGDHRSGTRGQFRRQGDGIGLERQHTVLAEDLVLVGRSHRQAWDEQFPDAAVGTQTHGQPAPIPAVEVPDDRYPTGIGCPDREAYALHPVDLAALGAKGLAKVAVTPLVEQIEVGFSQQHPEGIGIFGFLHTAGPADHHLVGRGIFQPRDEQAGHPSRLHLGQRPTAHAIDQLSTQGVGQEGADDHALAIGMGTKHGEGIAVLAAGQRLGFGSREPSVVQGSDGGSGVIGHARAPDKRVSTMATTPRSGMLIQVGRLAAS